MDDYSTFIRNTVSKISLIKNYTKSQEEEKFKEHFIANLHYSTINTMIELRETEPVEIEKLIKQIEQNMIQQSNNQREIETISRHFENKKTSENQRFARNYQVKKEFRNINTRSGKQTQNKWCSYHKWCQHSFEECYVLKNKRNGTEDNMAIVEIEKEVKSPKLNCTLTTQLFKCL